MSQHAVGQAPNKLGQDSRIPSWPHDDDNDVDDDDDGEGAGGAGEMNTRFRLQGIRV